MIPAVVPQEQHAVANSYISLAIGLGSVIAAGTAPFLQYVCHYQMSVPAQFVMAALAFLLAMTWTCMTIKEKDSRNLGNNSQETAEKSNFFKDLKEFFLLSPQVGRICLMQFFTWIGMMCLMIFFTSYAIHTVYAIPDLSNLTPALSAKYSDLQVKATNYSSICFAIFNLICFIIAIPIGVLAQKFGNKKVHIISLLSMVIAYLGLGVFNNNPVIVAAFMALSGIGWASVCALPFAMLSKFIIPGTEGSVMGIFNIFIAGPQVVVCTLVSWLIKKCVFTMPDGLNYHWEYAFFVGAVCLLLAALTTLSIKESK